MAREFSPEEQRIRKRWLLVFVFQAFFSSLSYSYNILQIEHLNFSTSPITCISIFCILGGLISGWSYWVYYSAYKNQQTYLLSFLIGMAWVSFTFVSVKTVAAGFSLLLSEGVDFFSLPPTSVIIDYTLMLAGSIIGLPAYLLNVRLRRMNKRDQDSKTEIIESL